MKLQRRERGNWFDRQRDFFIRKVVADFFALTYTFEAMYHAYCTCRAEEAEEGCYLLNGHSGPHPPRCRIWDGLTKMVGSEVEKGPLWLLKDLCQQLWPEGRPEEDLDDSLLDWLIGSIFHEAMKLKEDVYILNSYGSASLRSNTSLSKLTRIMDRKGVIRRVAVDVMEQMEQLAFLFGQASNVLRTMLPGLTENILLIRFLVEQEDVIHELWGESLLALFQDMFPGQPGQGFCAAGESYMQGHWYTRALVMYRRALEIEQGCGEAAKKILALEALIQQNSQFFEAA
jgi:hypothetical protein